MSRSDVTVDLAYLQSLEGDSKNLTELRNATEEFIKANETVEWAKWGLAYETLRAELRKVK